MYVGVLTNPPRLARRLTARPADPQGLGQPRGGEGSPPPPPPLGAGGVPPPPLQPPKLSHTPRSHTLAGGGPRAHTPHTTARYRTAPQTTTPPAASHVKTALGVVRAQGAPASFEVSSFVWFCVPVSFC